MQRFFFLVRIFFRSRPDDVRSGTESDGEATGSCPSVVVFVVVRPVVAETPIEVGGGVDTSGQRPVDWGPAARRRHRHDGDQRRRSVGGQDPQRVRQLGMRVPPAPPPPQRSPWPLLMPSTSLPSADDSGGFEKKTSIHGTCVLPIIMSTFRKTLTLTLTQTLTRT